MTLLFVQCATSIRAVISLPVLDRIRYYIPRRSLPLKAHSYKLTKLKLIHHFDAAIANEDNEGFCLI